MEKLTLQEIDLLNNMIHQLHCYRESTDSDMFFADDQEGRAYYCGVIAGLNKAVVLLRLIIEDPGALD